MITCLGNRERDFNAALNSLDVYKQTAKIRSSSDNAETLIREMDDCINQCLEVIENEIPILLANISTAASHLHDHNITTYDSLIQKCRETLNSFDPEGKITDSDEMLG